MNFHENWFKQHKNSSSLREGLIPILYFKTVRSLSGTRFEITKKEKHSGIRNRGTFATVLFFFGYLKSCSRKVVQTIFGFSLALVILPALRRR